MSPLPRWSADFDARAEAEAEARDSVVILARAWETDRGGPPQLRLDLSTGEVLVVRWDSTYQCRRLIVYRDDAPGLDCTPRDVGLPESVLAPLVNEVADATAADDREHDDHYGSSGADTWEEQRGER